MTKANYEDKMHIGYETFTKLVSVYFRGERKVLPTLYNSREEGIKAGEDYCAERGWPG